MSDSNNLSDTLEKILSIIGFSQDKNEFIKEFLNNVYKQTIGDLLHTISLRKQEEYINKMQIIDDPNLLISHTNNFFDKETFQTKLVHNYQVGLDKLIKSVETTLSTNQKQQLVDLKQSIEQQVGKSILTQLQK